MPFIIQSCYPLRRRAPFRPLRGGSSGGPTRFLRRRRPPAAEVILLVLVLLLFVFVVFLSLWRFRLSPRRRRLLLDATSHRARWTTARGHDESLTFELVSWWFCDYMSSNRKLNVKFTFSKTNVTVITL